MKRRIAALNIFINVSGSARPFRYADFSKA